MATPYVHGNDLTILTIAVAFLVRDGLKWGFLPGERSVMLFSWILLFLGRSDFASGWLPSLALFVLVVRRTANSSSVEFDGSLKEQSLSQAYKIRR